MSLSEKDVLHVARLAALHVTPEELEKMRGDLNAVLEYVEKLNSVSTRGVPTTSHVHGVVNAFRDDIIRDSFSVDKALENAPDSTRGGFRVPRIIG